MCGIVGYYSNNKTKNPIKTVLDGLKKLEYRGYDSAGISFFNGGKLPEVIKVAGKISSLEAELGKHALHPSRSLAIGHTRWATHGFPVSENAHPHRDCKGEITVVHNGIIENHDRIRQGLLTEKHTLASSTDSEVIAHLIERALEHGGATTLSDAVRDALRHLDGSYAFVVLSSRFPDELVAARRGSPLLVGVGKDEEEFIIASDASPIIPHTRDIVYLNDGEIVAINTKGFQVTSLESGVPLSKNISRVSWSVEASQKGNYEHFMLKEIYEAPDVIHNAIRGRTNMISGEVRLRELDAIENNLRNIDRIVITGCGTSYYAALVGKYLLEDYAGIPVEVVFASEFRYHPPVCGRYSLVLAISQSGETADTLEAIREAKRHGAVTVGLVNVVGSSIAREVDACIYNYAGPEVSVASTKSFISQLSTLVLFSLYLGKEMKKLLPQKIGTVLRELVMLPYKADKILKNANYIQDLARKYRGSDNVLFLGRKYSWPTALEVALKLKEISYIHAEGYAAGEMKHGPLALVDSKTPSIVLALKDDVYEKTLSNIEEVRSRRGEVIALATEGDTEIPKHANHVIFIPEVIPELSPLLSIIPLQLFAYYVAVFRGTDVDQPRNLAKSVTVE